MKNRSTSILALVPAIALVCAFAGQASAVDVTQIPWGGAGSSNLICLEGAHWTLSPGHGVINATVGVGTHAWGMVQAWDTDESWYIDTGPVSSVGEVALAYTGTMDPPGTLTLANCIGAQGTPTPPPPGDPGPTTSPSPTPSPVPPPQTPTLSIRHSAIVLCKDWTRASAKNVRLVRFNRNGVSVYRCILKVRKEQG